MVAVGGDRVACCDGQGRLTINGEPLDEPYVRAGDVPSEIAFDIIVRHADDPDAFIRSKIAEFASGERGNPAIPDAIKAMMGN